MFVKEYLTGEFRIARMQKRGMGKLFYVPFLVNWALLPALAYLNCSRWGDSEMARLETLKYLQYFVPFFLSWWVLLAFSEFIEGKGNELYYLTRRSKAAAVCLWLLFYLAVVSLPFFLYQQWLPGMPAEAIRLYIECFFFAALTYFLLFALSSAAMTMILLLIYTTFSAMGDLGKADAVRYVGLDLWSGQVFADKYLFFLLAGAALFALGAAVNHKYRNYQ